MNETTPVMCCDGPPPNQARRTRTAFAYIAWAAFGFVTGLHWAVLLCCVCATRNERFWAGVHLASYYVGLFLTAGGGGYVRGMLFGGAGPIDCGLNRTADEPGGMSRDCLWRVQTADYRGVYIMHFVGLGWCVSHWVADGLQLWHWCALDPVRNSEGVTVLLFSRQPLFSARYWTFLLALTACVTLTWNTIAWDTNGINVLGFKLLIEIVGICLLAAAVLQLHGRLGGDASSVAQTPARKQRQPDV